MLLSTEQLVERIHDSPTRIVLAATGGGGRAIADLLEVPGGSRTLLEAVVPYSAPAMIAWLGGLPDEFCSAATARAMAMSAFHRARRYGVPENNDVRRPESPPTVAGVACTASLATDRPKRGPHRVHLALQTTAATAAWHLELHKDRRTRAEEERLAGRLLLCVIAAACDLPDQLHLDLLEGEQVEESRIEAPPAWQNLLLGKVEWTVGSGQSAVSSTLPTAVCPLPTSYQLVLPGAFNPLHAGHRRMVQVAAELLGQPAAWELAVLNVDKPPLDYMEIARRIRQFSSEDKVFLSRAATFEEKSRLFAGATFLVGADTLQRIAGPQYYGHSLTACQCAIQRIAGRGCRFLVFGRALGGRFIRLADLDLPDSLRALCREVPPEMFREDVSSTELRRSGGP
jgi:hypothetical protein